MDRGRATCGGQKPRAPTTTLIGYSLRINAYYATRLGLRSVRERTEMLGGTCASTQGLDRHQGGALRVPLDRRLQQPSEGSP